MHYTLPGRTVLHIKDSTTKWDAFWQILHWAQLLRVHRGYGYCHLWVTASSPVWCLKIRLFYFPVVRLAGQDCEHISHKDFNYSAETDVALEPHQSWSLFPALSKLHRAPDWFPVYLASSSGGYKELQGSSYGSVKRLFSFCSPQWQWCCFWLGSLLLWIIHLMRTKLQVIVAKKKSNYTSYFTASSRYWRETMELLKDEIVIFSA